MANETYRCPLCPKETPPYELEGSISQSVFEFPGIGIVQTVTIRLADGTKHEHTRS